MSICVSGIIFACLSACLSLRLAPPICRFIHVPGLNHPSDSIWKFRLIYLNTCLFVSVYRRGYTQIVHGFYLQFCLSRCLALQVPIFCMSNCASVKNGKVVKCSLDNQPKAIRDLKPSMNLAVKHACFLILPPLNKCTFLRSFSCGSPGSCCG